MRWSGFKSVLSEFVLGILTTDKCGFPMVTVLGLCLEISPHPAIAWAAVQSTSASPPGVCRKMATVSTLPFQPVDPTQVWKADCNWPEKILYLLALPGNLQIREIREPQLV